VPIAPAWLLIRRASTPEKGVGVPVGPGDPETAVRRFEQGDFMKKWIATNPARMSIGFVAVLAWMSISAAPAWGGMVLLNPSSDQYAGDLSAGTVVAHARFRLDNNNWDLLLDRDGHPGNGNDLGQADLGTLAAMNGLWHGFRLAYSPVRGFAFRVTNLATGLGRELSWAGPPPAFNALRLQSRALGSATMEVGLDVRDLTWQVGSPHGTQGTLGSLDVYSPISGPSVVASNWLLADFDLASTEWEISGLLRPAMAGTGNPQERLRLYLDVMDVPAHPAVPEPLAAALLGLGALVLLATGRLRSPRAA